MSDCLARPSEPLRQTTALAVRVPTLTATTVKVLFVLCLLITAAGIWSDLLQLRLLEYAQGGMPPTQAEAEANDVRHGLIGLGQSALGISALIVFWIWLYRANACLRRLGTEGMKFTPGWCVGWYFIPIAWFWKPLEALREIWRASRYADNDWAMKPVSSLVGFWWMCWVAAIVLGKVALKLSLRAESLDCLITSTYVTLVADAADIPSYLASFALVGAVTAMQLKRVTDTAAVTPALAENILRPGEPDDANL
jgi:hypothetical protein